MKRIAIFADVQYRIYGPSIETLQDLGEQVRLRFARMTAYPIGVSRRHFVLERQVGERWEKTLTFAPSFRRRVSGACPQFGTVDELNSHIGVALARLEGAIGAPLDVTEGASQ